ncbi:hypothetical protein L7F22_036710 [Adiantum nelumboides]|nr:hypothetical protein [Adiantum nelumboides]
MEEGSCVIERLSRARFAGVPFALPKQALRTTEANLVRDVLQMVQGHPSHSFSWDESSQIFFFKSGLHLSHLSGSSLRSLLTQFTNAASSLRRIDSFVQRVRKGSYSSGTSHASPTLQAFASAVSVKLQHLRKGAVEKELVAVSGSAGTFITLLGLLSSLSWVCVGSEFLEQIVNEAVPHTKILHEKAIPAAELGAQILSFLYDKMSDYCLLQDGEEEAYGTLLMLFAGTLQPLTDALNSWLHEGFLDDPFGELFFYANNSVAIEDAAFWQNGFCLRYFKPQNCTHFNESQDPEHFSALDLYLQTKEGLNMQPKSSFLQTMKSVDLNSYSDKLVCPNFLQHVAKSILSAGKSLQLLQHDHSETGEFSNDDLAINASSLLPSLRGLGSSSGNERMELMKEVYVSNGRAHGLDEASYFKNSWNQWRMQTAKSAEKSLTMLTRRDTTCFLQSNELSESFPASRASESIIAPSLLSGIVHKSLSSNKCAVLPPLDDNDIYKSIFAASDVNDHPDENACTKVVDSINTVNSKRVTEDSLAGTDYGTGSGCGSLLLQHAKIDTTAMERLFPASTVLPPANEGWSFFELHPLQLKNRFAEKLSDCLEKAELKVTPLPQMLVQVCLINPIQKQVESVGKQVLNKLMNEWRLMEELSVLRAVYLIGSGDLLQQFSSVLFNKLDRGEPWDDFYELNTMLQESVRSSADGVLLPALDALVVTVQNRPNIGTEMGSGPVPLHIPGRNLTFGIDILDSLSFVYKVSWPLELIITKNAIKKYNQVMTFLFKVKRAKFALDKACRWMWKDGIGNMTDIKQQLLLQQKLMHFVNTLHQYVMDRVLYSAWEELCQGMAMARSLDEVIACHDAYLVSIQRQCLVAPDKLWALISSRVKTILSLALDFYSIQRTLFGGGAAPAIKARCQLEIGRIGRQFEECIVFLLRVLSFKLNVGHFPHLAELVTRINYNFYYVSESGHLLTPLPEVTGRKGSQQAKVSVVNHG